MLLLLIIQSFAVSGKDEHRSEFWRVETFAVEFFYSTWGKRRGIFVVICKRMLLERLCLFVVYVDSSLWLWMVFVVKNSNIREGIGDSSDERIRYYRLQLLFFRWSGICKEWWKNISICCWVCIIQWVSHRVNSLTALNERMLLWSEWLHKGPSRIFLAVFMDSAYEEYWRDLLIYGWTMFRWCIQAMRNYHPPRRWTSVIWRSQIRIVAAHEILISTSVSDDLQAIWTLPKLHIRNAYQLPLKSIQFISMDSSIFGFFSFSFFGR